MATPKKTKKKVLPTACIRDYKKSQLENVVFSFCGSKLTSYNYFVNAEHAIENLDKKPVCKKCRNAIVNILDGKE